MSDPAAHVYYWYRENQDDCSNKDSKLTSKQDKDSMETKKQTFNKGQFHWFNLQEKRPEVYNAKYGRLKWTVWYIHNIFTNQYFNIHFYADDTVFYNQDSTSQWSNQTCFKCRKYQVHCTELINQGVLTTTLILANVK